MNSQPHTPGGNRVWFEILLCCGFLLAFCAALISSRTPQGSTAPVAAAAAIDTPAAPPTPAPTRTIRPTQTRQAVRKAPSATPASAMPTATPPSEAAESAPIAAAQALSGDDWKTWPVMPLVSEEMRALYQEGLAAGNNPRAFSILGDCQSQPDVFLAPYDFDEELFSLLPPDLQETASQFRGMFSRSSPTIKDGTTEGALLWSEWNDDPEGLCDENESPLDCELRTNRPSIVLIHVGTHWEARSQRYYTIIIEKVLAAKAVPVLVTKADNREKDERINRAYAELALQYHLPLWNFWASVQDLPNHGMEVGSDMYLNAEGLARHRADALIVLDALWKGLR